MLLFAPATQEGKPPAKLWSVEKELGGWPACQRKFFAAEQILDVIQAEVGARRMEERRAGKAPARK